MVYDYDCNLCGEPLNEVNVVVSKALVADLPSSSKIGCINVVKADPFRVYDDEELNTIFPEGKLKGSVEISFDMIYFIKPLKLRLRVVFPLGFM